jgi:predicted nucleic acid-binding protein
MRGVLVDSNVILDVFLEDPAWVEWSESMLSEHGALEPLYINPIIYAEVSIGFERIEDFEKAIRGCGFEMVPIPREALFLAGKAFLRYKRQKGFKRSPLPDFFVGAHAAVTGLRLLTRDTRRIRSYFPRVELIAPEAGE